jgi:hypothetical protein
MRAKDQPIRNSIPFKWQPSIDNNWKIYINLSLDTSEANTLLHSKPDRFVLKLPFAPGIFKDISLQRVVHETADFRLIESGSGERKLPDHADYYGTVPGETQPTFVAVTITDKTIRGIIAIGDKEYTLAPEYDRAKNIAYVLSEKHEDIHDLVPSICRLSTGAPPPPGNRGGNATNIIARCVRMHFEIDDQLNTAWGGTDASVQKILLLFNAVAALYAREGITLKLSYLKVWNTPAPYLHPGTAEGTLGSFYDHGEPIQGNIAHLVHGRGGEGGYAAINGNRAVEGLNTSLDPSPFYSFDVYIIAHELGHNLGSVHTHNCGWAGGALDNCAPTEGGCAPGPAPQNGGTIMSYCHLTTAGINFTNGLGTQPGNLIRQRVAGNTFYLPCDDQPACTDSLVTGITITSRNTGWTIRWTGKGLPVTIEQRDSIRGNFSFLAITPPGTDSLVLAYPNLCTSFYKELRLTPVCPSGKGVPLSLSLPVTGIANLHPELVQHANQLEVQSTGSNNNLQWFLNGRAINGAISRTYTAVSYGIYTVKETSTNCSAVSNAVEITMLPGGDLLIYPNPATTTCTLRCLAPSELILSVQIFDADGRLMRSWQGNSADMVLPVQRLAAGWYLVQCITNQKTVRKKLVKY